MDIGFSSDSNRRDPVLNTPSHWKPDRLMIGGAFGKDLHTTELQEVTSVSMKVDMIS